MFEAISVRLGQIFKRLRGRGKLTERNIEEALREIRLALLEADVNYKVVKKFIAGVRERAVGKAVLKSLAPGQQVVKVVHEELTRTMGSGDEPIKMTSPGPTLVMLVGLQGGGKTTTCAKLGWYLKSKGHRPLLVATDTRRPAAKRQLTILGEEQGLPAFIQGEDPIDILQGAMREAGSKGFDAVLVDTAGRLHIDEELMEELKEMKRVFQPGEILLVADAMTGQDAVNIAERFEEALGIDGVILTKLDSDARGGAALSLRAVTGKPIKFIGVGEKLDALETFHPERIASRILGMGDVLTLVEKAERLIDEERARELEKKILKETFTLEDFLLQIEAIKRLGSVQEILALTPAFSSWKGLPPSDEHLNRTEAIIRSMTKEERTNPDILNGSRRTRIAKGSGTTLEEVNRLLKQFGQVKRMIREMHRGGKRFPWSMNLRKGGLI